MILYDNKPFLLGIKAFSGIIKRGKDLMNKLASVKIWEVLATIHSKIIDRKKCRCNDEHVEMIVHNNFNTFL